MQHEFTIGFAADGPTAPNQLRTGVFQGCPLSPRLFTEATSPLQLARAPDTGVQLSADDRVDVFTHADDLKTFSDTKAGIELQHTVVAGLLWRTEIRANIFMTCCGRLKHPTVAVIHSAAENAG